MSDMVITPDKLLSLEAYAKIRSSSRPAFIAHRRLRSVQLGEHLNLQFEDETTVLRQIQEMLHIEKIFEEEGIQSEIEAYASLVPDGTNWKATLLIEYPDPNERKRELGRLKASRTASSSRWKGTREATRSPMKTWTARTTRRRRPSTSCASSSSNRRGRRCAPAPVPGWAATTPITRRTSRSRRKRWQAWPAICAEAYQLISKTQSIIGIR